MRALRAVSLPSASHPTQYSIRIGCRFGCTRNDSSRDNVHFTALFSSQAARAVWAWLDMSSLPPKAPPFETCSTTTCSAGIASTDAIWLRSSQAP